jgi:hypothetical protein
MTVSSTDQIIHASFSIDEKDWIDFWHFSMIKNRNFSLMKKITFVLWIFIGFGPLIWTIYYYGFRFGNYFYVMDIFDWFLAFGPFLIGVLYFYVYFISGKKAYKKDKVFANLKYEYDFGIDDFQVSTTSDNTSGNSTIKTLLIKRIYETPAYFYLFNSNRTAFIVKKSAMSEEEAMVLRRRFQKVLDKKVILCK